MHAVLHAPRPRLGGVLFVEDFDAPDAPPPAPAPGPEPEEVAPGFTPAELEAARATAYAEGLAEGEARARAGQAATAADALARIATEIQAARGEAARVAEGAAEETARLLLSVLRAALPALCARHGEAELRHLARTLLPTLAHEPMVTLRASPHHLPALREEVARLDPDAAARIRLLPTDALPPGDLRAEWEDGSAARDGRAIRAAVAAALAPLGLLIETEEEELAHAG